MCVFDLFVGGGLELMLRVALLRGFGLLVTLGVFCVLIGSPLRRSVLSGRAGLMRQPGGGAILHRQLLPRQLPTPETGVGRLEQVPALRTGFGGRGVRGRADRQLVGGLGSHALRGRLSHGGLTDGMNGAGRCGQRGGRAAACCRLWVHAH